MRPEGAPVQSLDSIAMQSHERFQSNLPSERQPMEQTGRNDRAPDGQVHLEVIHLVPC